jgi:phospholipid-transporting ATPase
LIPGLSPTGRYTTLATLIFVLTVNGIKDALEDLQRHRQDKVVNTRKIVAVRGGELVDVEWQNLSVGDIVKLKNDDFIPADIVVLSTSDEKNSRCYIETSNMDGESDYKPRKGLVETSSYRDIQSISKMKGVLKAEAPNKTITSFSATLRQFFFFFFCLIKSIKFGRK